MSLGPAWATWNLVSNNQKTEVRKKGKKEEKGEEKMAWEP